MVEEQQEWVRRKLVPGVDPISDWALFRNTGGMRDDLRFSISIGLRSGDVFGFYDGMRRFAMEVIEGQGGYDGPDKAQTRTAPTGVSDDKAALLGAIDPPAAYYLKGENVLDGPGQFCLTVSAAFFTLLATPATSPEAQATKDDIFQLVLGAGLPDDALGKETPLDPVELPEGVEEKGPVITAVIDGGMPLAHARFRDDRLSTRIEYAWIQDGTHTPPANVAFGREFTKGDIDGMLVACDHGGLVNEEQFYRLSGQADFRTGRTSLAQRLTHGSHVMDLAAGRDYSAPCKPDNPIICVQLPKLITADTSGGQLEPFVLAALGYIWDRADRIAKARGLRRLPLVINFSYGFIAGPHDGTQSLELAMDEFIATRTPKHPGLTNIVLPAGNRFLSRCHAEVAKDDFVADRRDLTWRLIPDDHTPSQIQIWLPRTVGIPSPARLGVRVTPPGGPTSPVVTEVPGDLWEWQPGGAGTDTLCTLSFVYANPPTSRGMFSVIAQATRIQDGSSAPAPSGDWLVELIDTGLGKDEVVHAWIQRDDTLFGDVKRGRQSYFIDPAYQRLNPPGVTPVGGPSQTDAPASMVKKAGLINAIGTGERTLVAGGVQMVSGQMAVYSAGGPTLDMAKRKAPDAAAVSDTAPSLRGVLAAGTHSGYVVALDGTSVAAPRLARRVADSIAGGQPVTRPTVAAWAATDEAGAFANRPPPPPPERGGAGRVVTGTGYRHDRVDFP